MSGVLAWPQGPAPLVLTGGTVVDVSNWGRSAADLTNAVVIVQNGKITDVGAAATIAVPKGARVIDCTGKYIVPGLVDGFEGMSSQGQASANLYMGVTTAVVRSDYQSGLVDLSVNPAPHLYSIDSVGTTDDWSRLAGHAEWGARLKQNGHPVELSPDETLRQLTETKNLGTRVVYLGREITAPNAQWIIAHAHQLGMTVYGEFVATPYRVGISADADALVHMGSYELGAIPDELQQPMANDPDGPSSVTAFDYAERLPPTDLHLRSYAKFVAAHHAALMPTFARFYLRLPDHRNLWSEPAAALLDPARMFAPPDKKNGEMVYPLSSWTRHLPGVAQRYMAANLQKKADQSALRLWHLNQAMFMAYPHYLAGSGAPVTGSFSGISLHVELEMLVRLGLSPREALASATNNYALQFNWNELGEIVPGHRADILVLDGDPTANIWNARRISTLILDGNVIDRDALLTKH
ncbi:MAG TPA: amidohydrolase family protein [Terracidiphilus sp.]